MSSFPFRISKSSANSVYRGSFQALNKYLADLTAEEQPPLERAADNKKKTTASSVTADLKVAKGAKGSRGVKGLKRVDTTGMSNLSKFFKKKEPVKVEA